METMAHLDFKYLIPIQNVTVRSKVNYNMNAIREPSEPMGEDVEAYL